ncbi:putative Ig domain-containing protein [Vibrio metoecus]|uniref:putative Ig domain-containing protein n=1 Tax=Vibrio metoecus TaxID=1481663 RepID=UPI0001B99D2B|nr:putative Ig domain-containing protein [Vibrio metoecus]EEX67142.1 cell surface protein [Vibrio metoecus]
MLFKQLILTAAIVTALSGCNDSLSTQNKPDITPPAKPNNKPTITTVNINSIFVNQVFQYQIEAQDKDNDPLTYTLDNAPNWLSIKQSTGLLSGTPQEDDIGTSDFYINVYDGKSSVSTPVSLTVTANTELNDYSDLQQVTVKTKMNIPQSKELLGYITEQEKLPETDTVRLNNIEFINKDGQWYIINHTFMPIESLSVMYNNNEGPVLLTLDATVSPYTKAKITFPNADIENVRHNNQLIMFDPNIDLGEQKHICSDKTETCYNSPKIGPERETFERTLGYIHDSFNKVSFVSAIEDFFKKNCSAYSPCVNYTAENPKGISYGYRNYLSMGLEGHGLSMRVMRNVYAAEGMGGGSGADISHATSHGGGWASIWEEYVNVLLGVYKPLPMGILFHEIAHAYSFNHASGMTYGFADYVSDTYIPQQNIDNGVTPPLHSPDLLVDSIIKDNREIDFTFYAKNKQSRLSDVNIRVSSNKNISFTTQALDIDNKNKLSIIFNKLPENPVYVQAWDNDSIYMTTLKFEPYDIAKSPTYNIGNKTFTILSNDLLNKNDHGWSIRNSCLRPKTHLATKSEYQELYDHLHANNQLEQLTFTRYLSSDEPSGYTIWLVTFNQDSMESEWYSMHNTLGRDKGLICVTTR